MNTRKIGTDGEDKAVQYLIKNDFKIITRNFRKRGFEIDIVAEHKDGSIRFVEVKTVVDGALEDAFFSVENRNIYRYSGGVDSFFLEYPQHKDKVMAMDALIVCGEMIRYYDNVTSGQVF